MHALGTPLHHQLRRHQVRQERGRRDLARRRMCSPYAFYQFWLNTDDADVVDRLKVFTFRTREEIEELAARSRERPFAREAQRMLAVDVTSLVHGAEATAQVIAASAALFGQGDLADLDEATLRAAIAELPADGRPTRWASSTCWLPPASRLQVGRAPHCGRGRRLREQPQGHRCRGRD